MATGAVVAAGSALALYYVSRRGGVCGGEPLETHRGVHFAPTSFLDDLYFLAEGLRWVLSLLGGTSRPGRPLECCPCCAG